MYRLSLKLFLVLAFVAGPVLGFAPDASAHKNTSNKATVTGTVKWPHRESKAGDLEAGVGFDLRRPPGAGLAAGLTLDLRAHLGPNAGGDLNGCRLKAGQAGVPAAGGNSGAGLPLGIPGQGSTLLDLCFAFEGLIIQAVGVYKGVQHATSFDCVSSGTSTSSNGSALGTFYGEFTCDGRELVLGQPLPYLSSADGHFHGLSRDTTIAFLGELLCTLITAPAPGRPPGVCPGNEFVDKDLNPNTGVGGKEHEVKSRIKHTLACKGEVTPDPLLLTDKFPPGPPPGDGVPDTALAADVKLECIFA